MLSRVEPLRRLHIGGHSPREGWEILDARPADYVDHLCDARDLSRFPDHTFAAVYASHILEHFDYRDEMLRVLKEWHRVLLPDGTLYVSVPDLEVLCRLYIAPGLHPVERFEVMRIMFGGHMNAYDYHLAGIDQYYLEACLQEAGFVSVQKVKSFGLFQDTSEHVAFGQPISLNVVARSSQTT